MPVPLSFSPPERQGYNFGVKESIQVHNETGKDWGFLPLKGGQHWETWQNIKKGRF